MVSFGMEPPNYDLFAFAEPFNLIMKKVQWPMSYKKVVDIPSTSVQYGCMLKIDWVDYPIFSLLAKSNLPSLRQSTITSITTYQQSQVLLVIDCTGLIVLDAAIMEARKNTTPNLSHCLANFVSYD